MVSSGPAVKIYFIMSVIMKAASHAAASYPANGDIRLQGSFEHWEGRVEIFYNNTWGTVCDDYWDFREAQVVCRQLQYTDAVRAFSVAAFGQGKGPIWLDNVRCVGNETKLMQCPSNGWGKHNCHHSEDGGVACVHDAPVVPKKAGNCDFESGGGLCGYTNAVDDDFDWTLHQNTTPSFATGPTHDHTTGTGHYIFIETSWPRVQLETARLVSPQIFNAKCVQFFYHMKGETIGYLNVYIDDGQDMKKIWQMKGEQTQAWNLATVPVNLHSFKIVFEGVTGTRHTGDIAIDDITVLTSTCTIHPTTAKPIPVDLRNISNYVRLVGANVSSAGRVEILHNGRWGTVCGSHFHLTAAKVVCRQLGYQDVESLVPCCTIFPPGIGVIWLDTVHCEGREPSLARCPHKGWGMTRCVHNSDVGVICKTNNTLTRTQVRLKGSKNAWEGRVEVKIGGIWGTVNDMGWDLFDATVVCKDIGFNGATGSYNRGHFGPGSGPVWISNALCIGNETALRQCNVTQHKFQWNPHWHWPWWHYPFTHNRDAGAECFALRINGGKASNEGRVEFQLNGIWGTICNEGWDISAANVVCRQLGYAKASSLKPSSTPSVTANTNPILTRLKCNGDEASLGLCDYTTLLGVIHACTHKTDAQVVCQGKVVPSIPPTNSPRYCGINCPGGSCYSVDNHGSVCLCLRGTNSSDCDATIGNEVIDVRFDKASLSKWNGNDFKKAVSDQLNKYCAKTSCAFANSKDNIFGANEIVIMTGFPQLFGKSTLIRFVVLDPKQYSHKVFSKQTITVMVKQNNKLGGYTVHTENMPHSEPRKASNNVVKIVVPIVVLILIGVVAVVLFIIIKKRKSFMGESSGTQRYLHLSQGNEMDHDDPLLSVDDADITSAHA